MRRCLHSLQSTELLRCMSLLLALCGPDRPGWRVCFLRVKRTSQLRARTSEFDPKQSFGFLDALFCLGGHVRRVQVRGPIENVGSCAEPLPTAGALNIHTYCPTE
jgi:hypothetical protein